MFSRSLLALATIVFGGSTSCLASEMQINALDRGLFVDNGFQNVDSNAFAVGNGSIGFESRSWIAFDLSTVNSKIISAELVVFHRFLVSDDFSESVDVRSVDAEFEQLLNTEVSTDIFDDLGTGSLFASFSVAQDTPEFSFITIDLNSSAVSAMNDATVGDDIWSIGMSVSTLDNDNGTVELVFPFGNLPLSDTFLRVTTIPAPASFVVFTAVLISHRRRRRCTHNLQC